MGHSGIDQGGAFLTLAALSATGLFLLAWLTRRAMPVASGSSDHGRTDLDSGGMPPRALAREAEVPQPHGAAPGVTPPEPAAAPHGPPGGLIGSLRSRMDEVSYTPGRPNVLAMTKYVGEAAAAAPEERATGVDGAGRVRLWRSDDGDVTVVRVEGVVDTLSVEELRRLLHELVAERRPTVIVDLAAVAVIDSSGVGALVSLYKRTRAQGGVVQLAGLSGQPLSVFKMLRLDRVFTLA